jgi:hypothetical protein
MELKPKVLHGATDGPIEMVHQTGMQLTFAGSSGTVPLYKASKVKRSALQQGDIEHATFDELA